MLPLFGCTGSERDAFGSSLPQRREGGAADADGQQSGYWDLTYIMYPELLDSVGAGVMRELVSAWPTLERTLEVGPACSKALQKEGKKGPAVDRPCTCLQARFKLVKRPQGYAPLQSTWKWWKARLFSLVCNWICRLSCSAKKKLKK